ARGSGDRAGVRDDRLRGSPARGGGTARRAPTGDDAAANASARRPAATLLPGKKPAAGRPGPGSVADADLPAGTDGACPTARGAAPRLGPGARGGRWYLT